ncbi:DUF1573 domain-containing protein [Pedobacter hiemivivus]|uniref:DUF1573 domain-containing protein n=1 Tax=Pedobacter hiemivivus TaxID=2530454 RepID=A0A4R0MQ83_9SPHI|nr:DUF1573 domain-containing protein [Pedobacter hiemivivus]TCC89031.1 DUF1573 domain-containing protein [Pedobacter hiemivivus]TKC62594.1 DUF1573 domain-containing protein [Pedobacter hiemivivus]
MKKIFVLALAVISFASCQNAAKTNEATGTGIESAAVTGATTDTVVPEGEAAVMDFEKGNYDFGKITQGEKVSYSYKFKNSGKSPLIILNATATCGCTVPVVPKDPIKPGEEGEIKVVFDSNGKSGMQDKVITVTSNAQPHIASLHLTGEVKEQSN